jgi:hypothetical protein
MRFPRWLTAVAVQLIIPAAAQAQQHMGPEAHFKARIPQDSARAVALAHVPHGNVQAQQLRLEHGRLVYFYDIAVPGKGGLEELQISAADAQVLSVQHLGDTGALPESEAAQASHPASGPPPETSHP